VSLPPPSQSTVAPGAKLPAAIWVLGFVSMLMDISSELVHSLLPVFLVAGLGASVVTVGLIEGVAEATALIVKVFSGTLSDYLGRRKALAIAGYALGALTKPVFAVAATAGMVFAARFVDRIGKGIRGAPRDALVADLAPAAVRGTAYGLRQALDTIGAFVGPLAAIALMLVWSNDFRAVFWVAVIPGALAVCLLVVGIREPAQRASGKRVNPVRWQELQRLGGPYWWVVAIGALFALARFSEAFLILRAGQVGLPMAWTPMVLVTMNLVYAAFAYPFGNLSDRMSHTKLLMLGLVALVLADVMLAIAGSWKVAFLGIAMWGLHMGITQGLLATMVADAAPSDLRGTAFGFFNLASGVTMLLANVFAGVLWDQLGSSYTFYAGILFCAFALVVIALKSTGAHSRA